MAWITSAISGGALANRQRPSFRVSLLMAHLVLLALFWHDRTAAAAIGADGIADTALRTIDPNTLATAGGLIITLALLMCPPSFYPIAFRARREDHAKQAIPATVPPAHDQSYVQQTAMPRALPHSTLLDDQCAGLMARLHHDLRTPLNAMMGFADMMQAETFGPLGDDRYRAYAAHMQTCGKELLEATQTTLNMATLLTRAGASNVSSQALETLVAAASLDTMQGRPHHRRIECSFPAGLAIKGDMASVQQGLANLLSAAIALEGSTGPISIAASSSHGRVNASISVQAAVHPRAPTTGCRPATSVCPAIEALPISISRTLFNLQGIAFVQAIDACGRWTASLSFEAAYQSDLFDVRPQFSVAAPVSGRADTYSAGFLGGASLPASSSN